MIFHENNEISQNFLAINFTFIHLWRTLLTFAFATFKSWPQNFGLISTDLEFQNFRLGDGES